MQKVYAKKTDFCNCASWCFLANMMAHISHCLFTDDDYYEDDDEDDPDALKDPLYQIDLQVG